MAERGAPGRAVAFSSGSTERIFVPTSALNSTSQFNDHSHAMNSFYDVVEQYRFLPTPNLNLLSDILLNTECVTFHPADGEKSDCLSQIPKHPTPIQIQDLAGNPLLTMTCHDGVYTFVSTQNRVVFTYNAGLLSSEPLTIATLSGQSTSFVATSFTGTEKCKIGKVTRSGLFHDLADLVILKENGEVLSKMENKGIKGMEEKGGKPERNVSLQIPRDLDVGLLAVLLCIGVVVYWNNFANTGCGPFGVEGHRKRRLWITVSIVLLSIVIVVIILIIVFYGIHGT